MKKKEMKTDLDLIQISIDIWKDKLKIILITLTFVSLALVHSLFNTNKYEAVTEINTMSIFEENLFIPFNTLSSYSDIYKINKDKNDLIDLQFNKITKSNLFNLALNAIRENKIIEDAIKKFKIADKKNFKDKNSYLKYIEKYALTLELLPPVNTDRKLAGEVRKKWTIKFVTEDKNKWEEALDYINIEINKKVRNSLIQNFNIKKNTFELLRNGELDKINNQIINAKKDYEKLSQKRLAFLKEQASIAKQLNIANNTFEALELGSETSVLSTVQTENPYYMRGFTMIEKEIELIKNREDKDSFTTNLFELEVKQRELLEDKRIEQIDRIFQNTPIFKSEDFKSANIIFKNTKYKNLENKIVLFFLATIIGLLSGIFYILFSNAIIRRINK